MPFPVWENMNQLVPTTPRLRPSFNRVSRSPQEAVVPTDPDAPNRFLETASPAPPQNVFQAPATPIRGTSTPRRTQTPLTPIPSIHTPQPSGTPFAIVPDVKCVANSSAEFKSPAVVGYARSRFPRPPARPSRKVNQEQEVWETPLSSLDRSAQQTNALRRACRTRRLRRELIMSPPHDRSPPSPQLNLFSEDDIFA